MVFSNPVFLFFFLPTTLLLYFVSPKALRNVFLLIVSLIFYAWGEELYVFILLGSIAINYLAGLIIHAQHGRLRLVALWLGIVANLLLLGYYKYAGFVLENLGFLQAAAEAPPLPIGISFFTFQALSYLIDLYFDRVGVQRNPMKLALYISLFPQLIAGPIVRYSEVEAALADRKTTRSDFSAYSDIAIGLGRIFGFRFPENFNYPYKSQSVTEFCRRWHMTLSQWFRDYLYIPLGGNRRGPFLT